MKTKTCFEIPALFLALLIVLGSLRSITATGFLHTQGVDIVDDGGQKIMLRGVGLGNWMLPEGYMWRFGQEGDRPRKIEKIVTDLIGPDRAAKFWKEYRAQYITQNDIRRIAQLGFNSVLRPPWMPGCFYPKVKIRFIRMKDSSCWIILIRWCKRSGIYVIIDMTPRPAARRARTLTTA